MKYLSLIIMLAMFGCQEISDLNKSDVNDSGSSSSSVSSDSGTMLWAMDSPVYLPNFNPDNSYAEISYDVVGGKSCFKLTPCPIGETKIQTELTPKLSMWIGNKIKFWVRLPTTSDVSNIGFYLYAKPFVWIDYNQVMGPFQYNTWFQVSIPITTTMKHASDYTNGGSEVWFGITFFTLTGPSPGVSSPINTNVNLYGITIQ